MTASVRQWDIGTWIEIDMGENVSTATDRRIHYQKPNGERGTWVASSRGSDIIGYQTEDGDLDVPAQWRLEGWCEFAAGAWTSTSVNLTVEPVIVRVE